mmetsp:Transcript_22246/g.42239  ORF Transcript_22246/g.42239 Transcript_22246/m.42239 type:complete len:326 (-) Transcript_22246:185-1162(-)
MTKNEPSSSSGVMHLSHCRMTTLTRTTLTRRRRQQQPPWIVLLVLFCGMMLIGSAAAAEKKEMSCPPDCGPFGTCTPCKETDSCSGERCQCDDNHAGDDCSLEIQYCPDSVNAEGTAETCLNGGRCVEKEIFEDQSGVGPATVVWRCDCTYATGDAAAFAGAQCEFPATQSCLVGGAESSYSFCVNGGDCVREIIRGQDHPGCTNCPGFEGRHCQYEAGKAPPEELQAERKDITDDSDDVKPGFIIIIVLLGCLVLGSLALFVLKRSNQNNKREVNAAVNEVLDDLKLNESADAMENDKEGESSPQNNDDEDDGEHKDDHMPRVV